MVNEDVFKLKISMGNTLAMEIANSHCNLSCIEFNYVFWESFLALEYLV